MKINNKGWSMPAMIGVICLFVFLLLFVTIIAWNYGIEKHSPHHIVDKESIEPVENE